MTHMLCKNQATFCENCIFIRATASSILQLRTDIPHLPLYSLRHKWERITKMSIPTKLLTDILMAVLFLLLMADRHTGNTIHEWLGVTLAGAFLLHTWLNRIWYKTLRRGRYDFSRVVRLILNMLLLLAILGTLASSVLISRTVFPFPGLRGELFARTLHVFCAHWTFLLAAAHLGIYGKRLQTAHGRRVRFTLPHWCSRASPVLCVVLAAYGAYAFLYRELIYPLTMNSAFMPWNGNEHMLFFLLDYGVIFFLCAGAAHMLSRLMRKRNAPVLRPAEAWD